MTKKRKESDVNFDNDNFDNSLNTNNKKYNDDYYEEPDIDDIMDDILPKSTPKRKRQKTTDEYYVKGADLIEEIKKYHQTKKEDAERRGVPLSERQRCHL